MHLVTQLFSMYTDEKTENNTTCVHSLVKISIVFGIIAGEHENFLHVVSSTMLRSVLKLWVLAFVMLSVVPCFDIEHGFGNAFVLFILEV